jgi:hypothetical protein
MGDFREEMAHENNHETRKVICISAICQSNQTSHDDGLELTRKNVNHVKAAEARPRLQ